MNVYWDEDTIEMSHGEGLLTVFAAMFREPGPCLMDEPEAALSFQSCLRLMHLMYELGKLGAQIICATHSPILASTPDADIIEVGTGGLTELSRSSAVTPIRLRTRRAASSSACVGAPVIRPHHLARRPAGGRPVRRVGTP